MAEITHSMVLQMKQCEVLCVCSLKESQISMFIINM